MPPVLPAPRNLAVTPKTDGVAPPHVANVVLAVGDPLTAPYGRVLHTDVPILLWSACQVASPADNGL